MGVSRKTVHAWLRRYRQEGLPGSQALILHRAAGNAARRASDHLSEANALNQLGEMQFFDRRELHGAGSTSVRCGIDRTGTHSARAIKTDEDRTASCCQIAPN